LAQSYKLRLGSLYEEQRGGEHRRDQVILVPFPFPFAEIFRRQDVGIDFPTDHGCAG